MAKTNDLYLKALEKLKKEIINGKYPFKSKLPSEKNLAEKLNISRTTLRKVLETLKEEGFIESLKGSGWFVCNKNILRYIPIIISSDDSNYRKNEILKGIQDYLTKIGFSPLLTFSELDSQKEVELILKLVNDGYKNIIIYPLSSESNVSFYQEIMRKDINLIFIDTLPHKITCDYVTSCNFLGGYEATKKLIKSGHKKIAFCSFLSPEVANTVSERYSGYLSALEQHNLNVYDEEIFIRKNLSHNEFVENIISNITATAIFASSDQLAVMLLNKFSTLENPPSIIGFDNSFLAQSLNLTSVEQNFYEIGKTAAELLYKRIINPTKNYEHIYIPISLIERN